MNELELTPEELRVLGSLVEKELTTPEQYPLTLNALVLACNQKSNRDPVVDFSEQTVQSAVTSAKTKSLVRFVHPSHGRSALRYAHTLADALGVSERQLALLAVMILRGPQTLSELRTRTARMTEFQDFPDLERELSRLSGLETPLVERQHRRPGQKEDRYAHLLGPDLLVEPSSSVAERPSWGEPGPTHAGTPGRSGTPGLAGTPGRAPEISEELAELRAQVSELAEGLSGLRQDLDDLRAQLGD